MAGDVVLGGVVELDGEQAVVVKFNKIHKTAGQVQDDFAKVDKSSKKAGSGLKRLKSAAKGLGGVLRRAGRAARGLAGGLLKIGGITGGVGLAGAVGLGISGIKQFGQFELDIARIGTLLPRSTDAMKEFGGSIREMSVAFGQSSTLTADSFFNSLSAGVPVGDLKAFQQVIGEAAVGGFTSQATAVSGLKKVMDSYGLSTGKAREVADAFFVTNKRGVTTFEELAMTIGRAAPTARAVGLSYKELLSAVASTTKVLNTKESISGLKALFANIVRPSQDALDTIAVLYDTKKPEEFFNVHQVKKKGFIGFLREMKEKTGGSAALMAKLFGSIEAFNVAMHLASDTGSNDMVAALAEMEGQAGQTKDAFDRVAETTGFKFKQIAVGLSGLKLSVGEGLSKGFGLSEISDIPAFFKEQSAGVAEGASAFAKSFMQTLDPAFSLGKIDFKGIGRDMGEFIGQIAKGIGAMISGIGDLVSAIGGLRGAIEIVNGLLGGDSPAARAAKREGAPLVSGDAVIGEVARDANMRRFGNGVSTRSEAENRALLNAYRGLEGKALTQNRAALASTGIGVSDNVLRGQFRADLPDDIKWMLDQVDQRITVARDNAEATVRAQQQAGIEADRELKIQEQSRKIAEALVGTFTDLHTEAGKLVDKLGEKMSMTVNLDQKIENSVNAKKKKKSRSKSSHRFERGKGDATLPTTFEQQFLVFDEDGQIASVPDQFVLIPEEPTAGEQGLRSQGSPFNVPL